jgi:hypothetical protein
VGGGGGFLPLLARALLLARGNPQRPLPLLLLPPQCLLQRCLLARKPRRCLRLQCLLLLLPPVYQKL